MKNILTLFTVFCITICFGQVRTDTIINTGIYKSYYCYALKAPLYVTYALYKGGGDCDREKENFSFGKCGFKSATNADYTKSGMERGHLANAEDFAFDCLKEKITFCYYNCVPQTRELNHGDWLDFEFKVRDESQGRKLFIVTGSIFGKKTIGKGKIGVPESCYKIVLDMVTKEILWCRIFPNDESGIGKDITLDELKKKLGYPLVP